MGASGPHNWKNEKKKERVVTWIRTRPPCTKLGSMYEELWKYSQCGGQVHIGILILSVRYCKNIKRQMKGSHGDYCPRAIYIIGGLWAGGKPGSDERAQMFSHLIMFMNLTSTNITKLYTKNKTQCWCHPEISFPGISGSNKKSVPAWKSGTDLITDA